MYRIYILNVLVMNVVYYVSVFSVLLMDVIYIAFYR